MVMPWEPSNLMLGGGEASATMLAEVATASAASPDGAMTQGSSIGAEAAIATAISPDATPEAMAEFATEIVLADAIAPTGDIVSEVPAVFDGGPGIADVIVPDASIIISEDMPLELTIASAISPNAEIQGNSDLPAELATASVAVPNATFTLPANTLIAVVATAEARSPAGSISLPQDIQTNAIIIGRRPPPPGIVRKVRE